MQTIDQLILDESNMAFHPMMGNSYEFNTIGREILTLVKHHKTKDEIIETLLEKYDVSKEELFIDVSDFFAKLKAYGLVL